jgi:LysM repeat protein
MVSRGTVARFGAPLAFLAAVTAGVLLVRSGLDEGKSSIAPPPAATTPAPSKANAGRRFYRIRAGDTLAAIAPRFDTTEAAIVVLNPGLEPTALRIGQRIRVR